jgi:hypothetical protein
MAWSQHSTVQTHVATTLRTTRRILQRTQLARTHLVHVVALLADALDECPFDDLLGGRLDVGDVPGFLVHEEGGGVALGVLAGLDGPVLAVGVVARDRDDPRQRMRERDQNGEPVLALAPDLAQRSEPVRDARVGWQSEPAELLVHLVHAAHGKRRLGEGQDRQRGRRSGRRSGR